MNRRSADHQTSKTHFERCDRTGGMIARSRLWSVATDDGVNWFNKAAEVEAKIPAGWARSGNMILLPARNVHDPWPQEWLHGFPSSDGAAESAG